jgi:hypothetical protein
MKELKLCATQEIVAHPPGRGRTLCSQPSVHKLEEPPWLGIIVFALCRHRHSFYSDKVCGKVALAATP